MQMLDEAVEAASAADEDGTADSEDWEPVRLDVNVDAYVPADYIPYEQAKVDVHRRIAAAREVADLVLLREELEDRFGELPRAAGEPDPAAAGADQARPGRRHGGLVPRRPAGRDAGRARLGPGQADPGRDPRGAVRVRQVAAVDAGPRRPRRSSSRPWCGRPTCCWRSRARRRESERTADVVERCRRAVTRRQSAASVIRSDPDPARCSLVSLTRSFSRVARRPCGSAGRRARRRAGARARSSRAPDRRGSRSGPAAGSGCAASNSPKACSKPKCARGRGAVVARAPP